MASLSSNTQANGKIIYVAPGGNNNNSGSITQPLRTIQAAVDRARAGDTVYVRGGTYFETVRITRSGASNNPITVKAYPGETPVIDGRAGVDCLNCGLPYGKIVETDPKTGQGYKWGALVGIQGDYVIFEGFIVKRSLGRGIVVWRYDSKVSNVTLRQNQVLDSRNVGILLGAGSGVENALVENNVVWRAGSAGPWVDERGSSAFNWPGALVVFGGNQVTVRANIVYENWAEGIVVDAGLGNSKNIIVEDNVVYNNFALQIYIHRVENLTVQRNFTYHTNDPNWRRVGNPSACIVVNNESQFGDAIVTKNIDIVNNIAVGCSQNLGVWGSDGQGFEKFLVAYNTFVNAVRNKSDGDSGAVNFNGDDYRNFRFENNVIYQGNTSDGDEVGQLNSDVSFANNLWYPHLPESGEGSGPGDIVGKDPRFADPRAYELPENWTQIPDRSWFRIKSSSPAIDQGRISQPFLTSTDIFFDLFFGIRDQDPDIGVHEYGSNSPIVLICQVLGVC